MSGCRQDGQKGKPVGRSRTNGSSISRVILEVISLIISFDASNNSRK